MEITWTYCIFANGVSSDKKDHKQVTYKAIGKGLSYNQQRLIESSIANLE